ncbi:MAG: DNA cytosine methyltransferase [Isosphaeraceae bacterium]
MKSNGQEHAHKAPTILDLFCGAGGLSAGFTASGYRVVAALDHWGDACASYRLNEPQAHVACADIAQVKEDDIASHLNTTIDLVLGGPSCQGFSTSSGLSRNGRKADDPRNSHFQHFVRFVSYFRPLWVVMENVPGLLLYEKGRVARAIHEEFKRIGYYVVPIILLAADHGVPQLRRRLFFVGNRTGQDVFFPSATHGDSELWKDFALPFEHLSRIGNKNAGEDMPPHVSIREAISDLPAIKCGEEFPEGPHPSEPQSEYQRWIRSGTSVLTLHRASKLSPSDRETIPYIKQGQNWRDLPEHIRGTRFAKIRSYDATTMLKRPDWNVPSYTITTKFNDATAGAFIHPLQDRTFSLREGARLQSFPDRIRFTGSDASIRKQIGNAVPPLIAERLARAIAIEVFRDAGSDVAPTEIDRIHVPQGQRWEQLLGLKESGVAPGQRTLFDLFE